MKRKGMEKRSERGREGCREIWREEERKINRVCVLRQKYKKYRVIYIVTSTLFNFPLYSITVTTE